MASPGLCIRQATLEDVPILAEMEAVPGTRRYLGVIGREFHQGAVTDPDMDEIVADVGGEVTGFAVLAGLRTGEGRIELRRIVIDDSHRGGGYGRLLFRAAVSQAYQQHGAREVWLDVKPDNTVALTLYVSEGFVRRGTVPDPVDPEGELLLLVHTPSTTPAPHE